MRRPDEESALRAILTGLALVGIIAAYALVTAWVLSPIKGGY